jgi:DNA-binding winged helix-turn-helix (wHTH) protein/ATP/maltotriose-dependent transcriptional regulator MalT
MLDGGWRFGPYELHAGVGRVLRGRKLVPLTETEIQLLTMLVRHGGEIVPRETLLDAVWSSRVTEPNVLAATISRLRQQLGDDIVPTAERGGYRLGAPVEALGSTAEQRALHLCALFLEAEDKRQRMPDADWDRAYLGWADEVRQALDWALAQTGRKHIAIRLAGASGPIWPRLSALPEGRCYFERVVPLIDTDVRPADAGRALRYAGIVWREADRPRSVELFQRAATLYRQIKDKENLGTALGLVGGAQLFLGQYDPARTALLEAEKLLTISDRPKALFTIFNDLGVMASMRGMMPEAMRYFSQARDMARLLDDTLREYVIVINIGEMEFGQGAVDRAIERANEAVIGLKSSPDTYRLRPLVNLATYHAVAGNAAKARKAAAAALPLTAAEGGHWLCLCLQVWAFLGAESGRYVDAARLFGYIEAQSDKLGEVKESAERRLRECLTQKLSVNLTSDSLEIWRREGAGWSEAEAMQCVRDRLAPAERSRPVKTT